MRLQSRARFECVLFKTQVLENPWSTHKLLNNNIRNGICNLLLCHIFFLT